MPAPYTRAAEITPDADAELPFTPEAIFVGVEGQLRVQLSDDTEPVTLQLKQSGVLPISPKRILPAADPETHIMPARNIIALA